MFPISRQILFFRLISIVVLALFIHGSELSAQGIPAVTKIKFTGNETIAKEVLLKQMNTKRLPIQEILAFWKKNPEFSNFTLDEDIIRLKKYYQRNGYLDPRISYELFPNKRNKKLKIIIQIEEGKAVVIGDIAYTLSESTISQKTLDSIKRLVPLKPASRFRDENVSATEALLSEKVGNYGYPFVKIDKTIVLKGGDNTADLLFKITPGQKSFFGPIDFYGDSLIPKSLISKHIALKKGDLFSQAKLESTQQELFELGLFRYVTIRALTDSLKNNEIPIVIKLSELPRWSFKAGLGYGTEDKIRISTSLTRLNFLGGGRTLIIKGLHSYFIPLNLETKFIQPDVVIKDLDFILNPFFSREREESYEVDRWGTAVSFQKKFTARTSSFISYSFGKDLVDLTIDSAFVQEESPLNLNHNKSGITFGFSTNTTNDLFNPSKGWKLSGMATYMGIGFSSDYHYYKLRTELAYFHPLSTKVILATKIKAGVIKATQGDLITPIEDRFLMGGASSLRGWGRNQISPISENGIKTGGNSIIEASAEVRFPIYGIISGTAFMDVGNTWLNSWQFDLANLYYDAGLGLRIRTPIGPIRLDTATPIINEKFHVQFFITIGHAF